MAFTTAQVYLMGTNYAIDRLYEYFIPPELAGRIRPGQIVLVPFGKANRKMTAVVYGLGSAEEIDRYKPLLSAREDIFLTDEEMRLALFIKEQTFCTVGDAIRTILPPAALTPVAERYFPLKEAADSASLPPAARFVFADILRTPGIGFETLKTAHGDEIGSILNTLTKDGYIQRQTKLKEATNIVYEEILSLTDDRVLIEAAKSGKDRLKGERQMALLTYLEQNGSVPFSVVKQELKVTSAQVKSLKQRRLITVKQQELHRNPYHTIENGNTPEVRLTEEQARAYERIAQQIDCGEPKAVLLHGITGSGKTMVIKAAIDRVLAEGRQVILLIPEIALTPQTVSVFCSFYKDRVAVIHSGLSQGERFDAWRKIRAGEIDLCIGTRSAVFAPFPNLGMIVLDEEHEHTYKSEQSPRYHARDIARFRCNYHKSLMLLASATPSVESYYKAKKGIYTLVELKGRFGGANLPETVICDLRLDSGDGVPSPVGSILADGLASTLAGGQQAILFVNRRGYNSFLSCPLCGKVVLCPHCSVSLTRHNRDKHHRAPYLSCHYCGYQESVPAKCPECGADSFQYIGFGTQKAEEVIGERFPKAKILRMDADTTSAKFSYDQMLEDFRGGKSDILIGTQMVTKGHDFPKVTLVGVLSADNSLYTDDYRANERTFALLTQVVGRAGRGETPGRAIIQTYSPDHPVLTLAATQDYGSFYQREIALRKALTFPPYCDLALVTLACPDEGMLQNTTVSLAKRLKELLTGEYRDVPMVVFGPFEAPVYKVNETYRMRVILKCKNNQRTRALLSKLLREFSGSSAKKVILTVDLNPASI
ncbi:MAG: primosomal protein N' [Eubacteriales bacterium]